jgi:phage tail-like protein
MPDREPPKTSAPLIAFNFAVEVTVEGISRVCGGAFAECDGLEMSMEVKTIREGGNNGRQIRLTGPSAFGTLTLKRGMTDTLDLWDWFEAVARRPGLRADARVVMLAADGQTPAALFKLSRCVPIKIKAPPLNARDGVVAVEEFQIAYESLLREKVAPPPSKGGSDA